MLIQSYDGFTRDIVTVSQRDSMVEDLQELIAGLYKTAVPLRKQIETMFLPQQAEWLLKSIKQPLNNERLHSTESMLTNLINTLTAVPICTLTVATTLTYQQLSDIQEWLIRATRHTCYIDLRIDRSLIGGAQIQYGGRFTDKSLKLRLTDDEIIRHIS